MGQKSQKGSPSTAGRGRGSSNEMGVEEVIEEEVQGVEAVEAIINHSEIQAMVKEREETKVT